MSKKHDCISKVRHEIMQERPEVKWVKFDLSDLRAVLDNGKRGKDEKTGQEFVEGYAYTKKGGETIEKTRRSFVSHNYCPFCGYKYQD